MQRIYLGIAFVAVTGTVFGFLVALDRVLSE